MFPFKTGFRQVQDVAVYEFYCILILLSRKSIEVEIKDLKSVESDF